MSAITRVRTSVRENHLSVEQMAARGITEASIALGMRTGELMAWVAEAGGDVVAFAMVEPASGKLFALFTHPDHEGRGYGLTLLKEAENWLAANGCNKMQLDTGEETSAVAFYAKRGFAITSRRDGDVFMTKTIG